MDESDQPSNEGRRPFRERVELRIAHHKVADVFETCSKFGEPDKRTLFEEISKRLLQHMPPARVGAALAASASPSSFADRCLDLAAIAPNDKIRNVLLTIASICEAESKTDA
jgi:hypothetical protein